MRKKNGCLAVGGIFVEKPMLAIEETESRCEKMTPGTVPESLESKNPFLTMLTVPVAIKLLHKASWQLDQKLPLLDYILVFFTDFEKL